MYSITLPQSSSWEAMVPKPVKKFHYIWHKPNYCVHRIPPLVPHPQPDESNLYHPIFPFMIHSNIPPYMHTSFKIVSSPLCMLHASPISSSSQSPSQYLGLKVMNPIVMPFSPVSILGPNIHCTAYSLIPSVLVLLWTSEMKFHAKIKQVEKIIVL